MFSFYIMLFQLPHVIINCVECYTLHLMFENILNTVSGHLPAPHNDFTSYVRCDTMNQFIHALQEVVQQRYPDGQTVYIVREYLVTTNQYCINDETVYLYM